MTYAIHPVDPTYYFTAALNCAGDDLLVQHIECLRQAVRVTRAEHPFQIAAWVVMPDHLHTIWTLPAGDHDAAGRWRLIKARFSARVMMAAHRPKAMHGIWRRGLWQHRITNSDDMALHMRSCEMDPVRHGLVDLAQTWPYSSFRALPAIAPDLLARRTG